MPSKTRTGLIALTVVAPLAAAAALFSNATAQGRQLQQSSGFLMAQAETTEQNGMMGQGDMGGMMNRGEMGQGEMGGMMNMMQQMSRMMESCSEMMQSAKDQGPDQQPGGDDAETQQQ